MQANKKRPILWLLIDGLADYHTSDTPSLLKNDYHALHQLAKYGLTGLLDPVQPGLACGSDTAHMSLFGYNPFEYYAGRGAFETIGSGLQMGENDIGFKCNFAYMEGDTVIRRRVDREFPSWGIPLVEALNNHKLPEFPQYSFEFKFANEHRCGLKVSGPGLSHFISGTDPLKDNLQLRKSLPNMPGQNDRRTAQIINSISDHTREILNNHPINLQRKAKGLPFANVVLLRGAGSPCKIMPFKERWGLSAAVIAPTRLVKGLAINAGMEAVEVEGATGDYKSDYKAKIRGGLGLLRDGKELVFIHFKSVDESCHDKSRVLKEQMLHKINQAVELLIRQLRQLQEDVIICITSDHSSPVDLGEHSFQPVPVAITTAFNLKQRAQKSMRVDKVTRFDEVECGGGDLGRTQGCQVLRWMINEQDRVTVEIR